jgi:hypothetical protein
VIGSVVIGLVVIGLAPCRYHADRGL